MEILVLEKDVATFAYFSVTMDGTSTTTAVTGSTGKIATLTYVKGTANAYLKMVAGDMAQPSEDTKYYASINEASTDSIYGGIWINESGGTHQADKIIDLGGVSLSGQGETDKYDCTYTITLTKDVSEENADTFIGALNESGGELMLNISGTSKGNDATTDFDLKELKNNSPQTFTRKFTLDTDNNQQKFDANIYFVNKTTEQNELKDKKLNLKFETSANCELQKASGD